MEKPINWEKSEIFKHFNANNKFLSSNDALKRLEGKLLGLVDVLSLETEQKNALKAAVRQYIWGIDRVHISPKVFDETIRWMQETRFPAESIMSNEELGQDDI